MLKKKIRSYLLVLALLFLTACSAQGSDGVTRIGDTKSRDPLRICVDVSQSTSYEPDLQEDYLNDLLFRLKETAGLEDVVIEIVPPPESFDDGENFYATRSTALDRIRTEIMAGEGPDVFIQSYIIYTAPEGYAYDETDCLFKYPEKAMANGLFLPLDEYIENYSQFAEWDKLTQSVLDAGRNEEGLQIVPLNYTFPLLCYPKSEWEHIPDKKYTWNDMLTSSELLPHSLDLANCRKLETLMNFEGDMDTEYRFQYDYIHYILGEIADFKNEELNFTEEELLALVKEVITLEQQDSCNKLNDAQELSVSRQLSERKLNKPMTFLPLYSIDGGITAYIDCFAAVNRNTKRPEDAFKVIEILMSKHFQRWSDMSSHMICGSLSIPLHEELFQESDPLVGNNYYMTDENFEAFCKVREQITGANFESEGTTMLLDMMSKCFYAEYHEKTIEEIVHETYVELERRVKE